MTRNQGKTPPRWKPLEKAIPMRDGKPLGETPGISTWMNDLYVVTRTEHTSDESNEKMIHLSIRRQDRKAVRDWRHFQRIKNELAGPDWEGVEVFPAETRKVDTANQYHLWCFPFILGFGLGNQRVVADGDEPEMQAIPGAVQRPNAPEDLEYGGKTEDLSEFGDQAQKLIATRMSL